MTYEDFKEYMSQEETADPSTRMDGEYEILIYRNTQPNAYSELYGIAMTGIDGLFYKISIFTGENEDYSDDAPVWEIAEVVAETARHQDFSEWGIEDTEPAEKESDIDTLFDMLDHVRH